MEVEALRVFLKVAELGSFTQAGTHLDLSKSRVSQLVQALETDLGVALFQRTTRVVQPTSDGEQLIARARRLLAEADEIEALFQGPRNLRGRVRIALPSISAHSMVIPRLAELLALHPQLEIEISASDRYTDILREGIDCALRVGPLTDSSLVAQRLGVLSMSNYVSPAYVRRFGAPQTLADLDQHYIVHYATTLGRGGGPCFEYHDGERWTERPMKSLLTVDSSDAYRAACSAGLGIVQLPNYCTKKMVEDGAYIEVLPEHPAEPMPVALLHAHGKNLPKRVRAVMTWIASLMEAYCDKSALGVGQRR